MIWIILLADDQPVRDEVTIRPDDGPLREDNVDEMQCAHIRSVQPIDDVRMPSPRGDLSMPIS
jgi:hypothetical protein